MSNESENSVKVPNPVHYTGRALRFGGILPFVTAACTGLLGGAYTAVSLDQAVFADDIDNVGSAQQEELVAEHQRDLTALKTQKLELSLAEAQFDLNKDQGNTTAEDAAALTQLQDDFEQQAHKELMDLYLQGASNDGAGISEQDFYALHDTFLKATEGQIDFEAMGYDPDVEHGALDDALARVDIPEDGSKFAQHNTMQEMNEYMAEQTNNGNGIVTFTFFSTTFLLGNIIFNLLMGAGNMMADTSRKIPVGRRKKRHLSGNIKH